MISSCSIKQVFAVVFHYDDGDSWLSGFVFDSYDDATEYAKRILKGLDVDFLDSFHVISLDSLYKLVKL